MIMNQWQNKGSFIPFDRPVENIPTTSINSGTKLSVCFNEEWLPLVLGALKPLARYETYKGTDAEVRFAVSQGMELLASINECSDMIQFQQTLPCLLEYSTDGGITWHVAYDGQQCINENINDGTLAAGTTANPSKPVAIGGCQVFHIQVQEQTDFVLPTTVNSGDVITVADVSGAWADGWLGNLWYCYDGSSYVFGTCISGSNPAKSGDPLSTAQHQQLICKVDSVYYNPLSGAITVPSGVTNGLVSFLPNNGSARSGGTGVVSATVTVCNNAQWERTFDFAVNDGGWYANAGYASYSSGAWHAVFDGGSNTILSLRKNVPVNTTINYVEVHAHTADNDAGCRGFHRDGETNCSWWLGGVGDQIYTHTMTWVNPAWLQVSMDGYGNDNNYVTKIILRGTGANPF